MIKLVKSVSLIGVFTSILSFAAAKDDSFNLVILPDTQTYAQNYPEIFHKQFQWVADNATTITFAIQNGDITNNNRPNQWAIAAAAFNLLDGKVPLTFVQGNHDLGPGGTTTNRDSSNMNKFLPLSKHKTQPTFGGSFEKDKIDNIWHTFKAAGKDWLIISLEFGPRTKVLDWANEVVKSHPNHKVIVNTHAYMYNDNTRITSHHKYTPKGYGVGEATGLDSVNDGEDIWNKFVKKHSNIFMVVSGHVLGSGVGQLVSKGEHGNNVYQMLANFQKGVINTVNGGNGYLRIVNINPRKETIDVKTWSPVTQTYKTEPDQQFEFTNVGL